MSSAFFADLDDSQPTIAKPKKNKSSSFFSDLPEKSPLEKTGRLGAQYGIGLLERAALPYDISVAPLASESAQFGELRKHTFEDIEQLLEQKQTGAWEPQDELLLNELTEQVKHPEKMQKHVRTMDISSGNLIEKGAKKLGYNLEPEGLGENVARLTGNFFKPKTIASVAKSVPAIIKSLASKEGRAAMKLSKQWKSLEKTSKGNSLKEDILRFAKEKKLTPEEATLLLQSKGDIDLLGKISKKSKRFKGNVEGLKNKLQDSYKELKDIGSKGGYLNLEEADKLTGKLGDVLTDINKTYVEGPDTKSAGDIIEKTIQNINNKPGTIEDLINSRRNLRQFKNWGNLHEGDAIRSRAENAFFEAIKDKNPEIAKKLVETDKAWAQYKKFEKLLNKPSQPVKWHGIPVSGALGAMAFAGAGLTGHLPLAIKAYALKEGVQRLSTRLLTDPKFQGIHKRMLSAIKSGSQKQQQGILTALGKVLKKEDPELYEDFKDSFFDME
jgi:hypothetical protein